MGIYITRKNRLRPYVGKLKLFTDLPNLVQNDFKTIKNTIIEQNPNINGCFVYGSHYHGFSDSLSDYDLIVDGLVNMDLLRTTLFNKVGKIDVQYLNNSREISIP